MITQRSIRTNVGIKSTISRNIHKLEDKVYGKPKSNDDYHFRSQKSKNTGNKWSTSGYESFGINEEMFSFKSVVHLSTSGAIMLVIFLFSLLLWTVTDNSKYLQQKHVSDKIQHERLYDDTMQFMRMEHAKMLEQYTDLHHKEMQQELDVFMVEMKSIKDEQTKIDEEHATHHEKVQIAEADHTAQKEHRELLEGHIDTLYKNAGDEITRLNEEISQCNDKKVKLLRQVEEAKAFESNNGASASHVSQTQNNQQQYHHEQVPVHQQNAYQSQSLHASNAYVGVGGNAHAYHDPSVTGHSGANPPVYHQ